jgi:hypothetical protein
MFGPWFTVTLLALESSEVVGLRIARLAGGGIDAQREAHLMVSEKIDAVVEIGARLLCGATAVTVINRFREQVAANEHLEEDDMFKDILVHIPTERPMRPAPRYRSPRASAPISMPSRSAMCRPPR